MNDQQTSEQQLMQPKKVWVAPIVEIIDHADVEVGNYPYQFKEASVPKAGTAGTPNDPYHFYHS